MIVKELEMGCVEIGRSVLEAEARALLEMSERLDDELSRAVNIILRHKGKVILMGMGKSGHVAQKIAATLSSTGTPAVYLHPAEALHGDLGIYQPGDPTILLSKSGTTTEIMRLMPTLRQFQSPIIAIVGNRDSPIAQRSDIVLDASVTREADSLGIVPTSSAIVAMAMGDVLASVLMQMKEFQHTDFALLHPGGQLGRNLLYCVEEVMHKLGLIGVVGKDQLLRDVVYEMTNFPLGAACVIDEQGILLGIITDGDIRRLLLKEGDVKKLRAEELMTKNPIAAHSKMLLADALRLMEDRKSKISVLPVIEEKGQKLLGMIRLHDIYQPG